MPTPTRPVHASADVMIAVDPHKASWTAVAVDRQQRSLATIRTDVSNDGYRKLRRFARRFPDAGWAVEGAKGLGAPLTTRLRADGLAVLDVPAKLARKVRMLSTGHGRKSDEADAYSVGVAALTAQRLNAEHTDDTIAAMGALTEHRDDLVRTRTQTVNRLHALLTQIIPAGHPRGLTADDAAQALRSVRPRTTLGRTLRQLAVDLVGELRRLDRRIATVTQQLSDAVEDSGTTLTTVYGIGPIVAAKLLARTGPVSRFRSGDAFASYAGVAPIEVSSGGAVRHRLSRAGDRQLNYALHVIAITQIRRDTAGKTYYQAKRSAGKSHKEALRCLKRRLADVVYRTMLRDTETSLIPSQHLLDRYRGVFMARRGRKRRLELESEYWRLLLAGVGTFEACRIVGIGHKTGYRWRAENGGLPPVRLAEETRSTRYLSLLERQRIATLRHQGWGVRAIAAQLGRAASTISRELRRNLAGHDRGYDGDLAHSRARERARRPRHGRLLADPRLRAEVQAKLELEWSPEQIAGWLRATYPDQPSWHVCHETIYQALYVGGRGGLSRQLTRRLRTGRPLRKRRRRGHERRPRFVAPAVLIDHRPAVVEHRQRVGDWEGDLIVGRYNQSAVATLVERASRYVRLVSLPRDRTAEAVREALHTMFSQLPAAVRLTLTWDQGSEMAYHEQLAPLLRDGVFFAHPGSPWERGTNENTNGLLRQYLPKGSDLSVHTDQDLQAIEHRLNHRPRKRLGWRTPTDIFTAALPL